MKKIILCLLLLFYHSLGDAQVFLGGTIDDYVGTWQYVSTDGNEVFTIKLKKTQHIFKNKTYDYLLGTYSYFKNGVEIVNNMSQFDTLTNHYNLPIYAGTTSNLHHFIRLYFNDYIFNKHTGSGSLHLMPIANRKFNLKWVLEDDEGEYFYEEWETIPEFIDGFSVPDNVILVKIE